MYSIVALCLLCSWVAPHSCRSVDTLELPSEDLEPFMSHHHHEGNIAELLIPLLERSLAQSEARDNERAQLTRRRSKNGKKVIQVLPYRDSEEHKRKGWRKLKSRKKQVVEITPLHGKNGAKPLAYILSAAKPKHDDHDEKNDDVSSSNTSELEHDKSTSEEQHSSEEKENSEDVNANTLRTADDVESPSASSNVQSSEDTNSKESKDVSTSDKEIDNATVESDATVEKSEENKAVVIENSEDEEVRQPESTQPLVHNYLHEPESVEAATSEGRDGETAENLGNSEEDVEAPAEDATTAKDKEAIEEDADATKEADTTVEASDATAETRAVSVEDVGASIEDVGAVVEEEAATIDDVEPTVEDQSVTQESVGITKEDKAPTNEEEQTTSEDNAIVEDNVTVESKTGAREEGVATTVEDQPAVEDDEKAAAAAKTDATVEKDASVEEATVQKEATNEDTDAHHSRIIFLPDVVTEIPDTYDILQINHPNTLNYIGRAASVETEASDENDQGFLENNIVISRRQESKSAVKKIKKLFNTKPRDLIELIQSSVEANKTPQRDCLENGDKHHDHKSYRLSFLFNK